MKPLKYCPFSHTGSIALMSVLIISAFTLILAIGMSEVTISTSYQYLNNFSSKHAYYVAESCLEEAILRVEMDPNFSSLALNFDSDTNCTIMVTGTTIKTVSIQIDYLDYVQNYAGQISVSQDGQANNVTLLQWGRI